MNPRSVDRFATATMIQNTMRLNMIQVLVTKMVGRHRSASLSAIALAVLWTQLASTSVTAADSAIRPNILLILTDDQGWGDVGVHGNSIISTPTLDRLAGESVRLNRFYVSPVCAPTRAALLTGRYPERTGVSGVTSRREVMTATETTMAEVFSDAGYVTGCFGKWHNGAQMPLHPNGQGFDEFFGFCGGHFNLYDDAVLERNGRPVQTKGYITDVLADAAIEFIRSHHQQPFFCYVPFNAPHGPFQVRQDLFDKYNDGAIDEKTAAVYAMVENIDSNVNRLLTTIRDVGKQRETIVVFLTDNGPNGKRFNGAMRGAKGSVHEGGCRVPCFIRWPGRLASKSLDQMTAHIDLLPTLAEWSGIELDPDVPIDGKSLVALIDEGTDSQLQDRVILTYRPNQADLSKFGRAAVRSDQYRLTIERGVVSLFDMDADPSQRTDVIDEHPKVAEQMESQIRDYVRAITPGIVDPKRVPITPQRPVFIPSVDAELTGGLQFADGISWSHGWVDQWRSQDDEMTWQVDFAREGRYEIKLHYVCDSKDVSVDTRVGSSSKPSVLKRFRSTAKIRPDLDSKSTPRRMQTFSSQTVGVFDVPAGPTTITLKRTSSSAKMLETSGITVTSADLPDDPSDFHLFLLAGQSNMAGRGSVTPIDRNPDERILMLDREGRWVPATDPVHFDKSVAGVGLGRSFAREYAAKHPGVTIGLVPCAVGGSPIAAWEPGGYHASTKTHPYDDASERITTAKEHGVFRGILWHQGESDSRPELAAKYESRLIDVLKRLRDQVSDVPIVIGGLPIKPSGVTAAREQITQAHRSVAEKLAGCVYVPSDGLTLKSDNTHFDRESLIEFGRRYAKALMGLK